MHQLEQNSFAIAVLSLFCVNDLTIKWIEKNAYRWWFYDILTSKFTKANLLYLLFLFAYVGFGVFSGTDYFFALFVLVFFLFFPESKYVFVIRCEVKFSCISFACIHPLKITCRMLPKKNFLGIIKVELSIAAIEKCMFSCESQLAKV